MARRTRRWTTVFVERPLEEISDADIGRLVTEKVAERQYLDFKLTFDHGSDDDREKLLRHVASLANGIGGCLIVGIRDDGHGRAQRFEGMHGHRAESRAESMVKSIRSSCRRWIEPPISGLEVARRQIDDHFVVLVRIPRSGRTPHMLKLRDATEFWTRYEDGKVQMTRHEIAEAFLSDETTMRLIRQRRRQSDRRIRPRKQAANLVQNGGFERDLQGWGTGLLESLPHVRAFANVHRFVPFGGAVARWFVDDREARNGRRSLRVEHESAYAPHVFSTLSQRVPIDRGAKYEVRFWAKVEERGAGAFCLRVVESPQAWDAFKVKVHVADARWQPYRLTFRIEKEGYVDIRFVAEGPLKAWIDDVSVRKLPA
jgi:hypothetical protein